MAVFNTIVAASRSIRGTEIIVASGFVAKDWSAGPVDDSGRIGEAAMTVASESAEEVA